MAINRIPISIKAKTPDELSRKCLKNNLTLGKEFDYYQVIWDGSDWVTWFHGDPQDFNASRRLFREKKSKEAVDVSV